MYTRIFDALNYRKMLNWLPDKVFLEAAFRARFGRKLNLNNPETFNEKLQWLKLYNRKPEYTKMVDKYLVRDYVKEKIGEEYLIPLLGVWDDPEKIDFDELPMQFVLKCNHNSGLGMCICKDKNSLDINKVKEELKKGINQNYYLTSREWPYKDVPRRIIAEKYMVDESGYELKDYKFYCFDGKVKLVMINSDRMSSEKTKANYFDENYQPLDFVWGYENAEIPPQKPEKFEEMKYLAEKLSEGITHVRIDFYQTPSGIYFGEITFFDGSGFDAIEPIEWDYKIGSWLKLPMEKVK
ncbi:ATP-grasp fold amidoligase family protein [Catenibacterium sp.]|uniref:ATP-grasp fold amidoligase family protein n=2 Tax=Bacillota TaxID=1239 RepID=UPI002E77C484|nr:ATP-grasp fold amidoligase family protein [Catenibacterium sp.]MEE0041327.1 ATP-grasp fold amidoligase family protein [Catenibacterium sp.]